MQAIEEALEQDLEDWELVRRFLPTGWENLARSTGALRRATRFHDASSLLRTLLIHLADGCSLKETALRAQLGGLANVSSVAVWKRLREAGEWFRQMAEALMYQWVERLPREVLPGGYRLRLVDASVVSEPGSTGSDWRIHYAVDLGTLQCDFVEVTDVHEGETLRRFPIKSSELLVGDRIYANPPGVSHVLRNGGDVLVRLTLTNLPLQAESGRKFPLLSRLERLRTGQIGDWSCWMESDRKEEGRHAVRVCAIKKSRAAAKQAREALLREARKKGRNPPQPDTLKMTCYIVVLTTAPAERLSAATALEVYRGRWQIELVFKRLKSLLLLGHLPKKDPQGARAWLLGKLFVAFLVEAFIHAGESFFPWGYPLGASRTGTE
ncbi:MAG TPA: IS4 family transposase [Anaerolineales bacterium]